jgi:hypothetical protein
MQLHYACSQVTSRGTKMTMYLLVVDENGYDPLSHEGRRGRKQIRRWTKKNIVLAGRG